MPFRHLALALRARNRQQPLLLWGSLSLLCVLFLAAGLRFGTTALTTELTHQNQRWSSTFATYLTGVVVRADMMTATLADDPAIQQVAAQLTATGGQRLNERLQRLQGIADVDALYLVNPAGRVTAASNWDQPDSFLALELGFRPYLRQALQQGVGTFVGMGIKSGQVGLYRAHRIERDGETVGVMVVKINLLPIETVMGAAIPPRWEFFLADGQGVVFSTSQPRWLFAALKPLTAEERASIRQDRQYPKDPLPILDSPFPLEGFGSERIYSAHELAPLGLGSSYDVRLTRVPETDIWLGTLIPRTEGIHAFLAYFGPALSLVLILCLLLAGLWHDNRRQLREHSRDLLTGLGLRRQMVQAVGDIIAARLPLTLILCDLDHFKKVNDRFGHLEGDRLLQETGRLVAATVRARDICIRYGGEEFAIFLVDCGMAKATQIAERLRQQVKALALPGCPAPVCTLSAGVTAHQSGETLNDLLKRADALLYQAKHAGRDRVVAAATGEG